MRGAIKRLRALRILLLAAIPLAVGRQLPAQNAYESWSIECKPDESVGGWRTVYAFDFEQGADLSVVSPFCRALNQRAHPKVKVGECHETEPFVLGVEQFKWKDKKRGCGKNEIVQAVYSDWLPDKHHRLARLKCCALENAKWDKRKIKCNSVGPFQLYRGGRSYFMKNPYEPVLNCPNDALAAIESSSAGLAFQYCPIRVTGGKYNDRKCTGRKKEGVDGVPIVDGDVLADHIVHLSELAVAEPGTFSTVGESWRMDCGSYMAVKTVEAKLERIEGATRDVAIKVTCGEHVVPDHQGQILRLTHFVELVEYRRGFYGCRQDEVLQGLLGKYTEDGKRYISLVCSSNAKAQFVSSTDHQFELRPQNGYQAAAPADDWGMDGSEFVHSLNFRMNNYADTKLVGHVIMSIWEETDARFTMEESLLIDEIGGVLVAIIPPTSLSEMAPDAGADAAAVADVDTGKLCECCRLEEGAPSEPAGDFILDCGYFRTVKSLQIADAGEGDFTVTATCGDAVLSPQSAAHVRVTKLTSMANFVSANGGCDGETELVQGLIGVFREEKRFIAFICTAASHVEIVSSAPTEVVVPLSDGTMEGDGENMVLANFDLQYTSACSSAGSCELKAYYHEVAAVEADGEPLFADSYVQDEINEYKDVIAPVLGNSGCDAGGMCIAGVKSKWFGGESCSKEAPTCDQDCTGWEDGQAFGELQTKGCQKRGKFKKCSCKYKSEYGSCLFDGIGKNGCVCLCARVCGFQNQTVVDEAGGDEDDGPLCDLGIATKYLSAENADEQCAAAADCAGTCLGWKQGLAFGVPLLARCEEDPSDPKAAGVNKCYCEYEQECDGDEREGPMAAAGLCVEQTLTKLFGQNHCPGACADRCDNWITGLTFTGGGESGTASGECVPAKSALDEFKDDMDERSKKILDSDGDVCKCTFESSVDAACDKLSAGELEPPGGAAGAGGEFKGTFGEVKVVSTGGVLRRRRRRRAKRQLERLGEWPVNVFDDHFFDVKAEPELNRWIVTPKLEPIQICPDVLCNCDLVCEDFGKLAALEADAKGLPPPGGGEEIEGTFGKVAGG